MNARLAGRNVRTQGHKVNHFVLIGLLLGLLVPVVRAEDMYWTDRFARSVHGACTSGLFTEELIAGLSYPGGIALDLDAEKIYLLAGAIRRANLDGSEMEELVEGGLLRAIALDVTGGKMYWSRGCCDSGEIWRANLDGSGIEALITEGLSSPTGIALDLDQGKVYWADQDPGRIRRANLDGSSIEDVFIIPLDHAPSATALDVKNGRIYWTEPGNHMIQRADLDGTNVERIVWLHPFEQSFGIALDLAAGKVYWTVSNTVYPYDGGIRRANLDGSTAEELVTGLRSPSGIALDLTPCAGPDCQPNGIPDECDLCSGLSPDCNGNDVPDECDTADGTSDDCNGNSIPDECEPDCNDNGVADECDAGGVSEDCNANNIPDECEPDCNGNGVADECDIGSGWSTDELPPGGDGIPDECQTDCNGNLVPDSDDISGGFSEDCDDDLIPDDCETDTDGDGVIDDCDNCELVNPAQGDCQPNGVGDVCDIASGDSQDVNGNDVPDECDECVADDDCSAPYPACVNGFCVGDARMFLLPAGVDPLDSVPGTPYRISAVPGEEVTFDVWVENTSPHEVGTFQVTMPCRAWGGGAGAVEYSWRFGDVSRLDWIYHGLACIGCPSPNTSVL